MKNDSQFTIGPRGLIACLAALALCQSLQAGGDAASFNARALDPWTESCVADMYYIVPTRAGTSLPYLVFTNSCRSSHGCEACLMFGGDVEANFSPFDWSRYYDGVGNEYAKQVNLPTDNSQYLTNRPDQFGVVRQMLHVRNGTYYLGLVDGVPTFQNKIDLFDFVRGDWDVFYSRNFTAASEAEAASWRGLSNSLAWMPMVETFGYYANKMTEVLGCDLARFFYDGKSMWQTPDNTSVTLAPVGESRWLGTDPETGVDDWWRTLSYAPNTHFTVCLTTSDNQVTVAPPMGSLCVTVNSAAAGFTLNTTSGTIDPFWVSTPDGKSWDKTAVGIPPGYYRITFNPVAGISTPPEQIFQITENGVTTVQAEYGGSAANTPVVVLTHPLDQQTLWGASLAATAIVAAGTPPYTVTYYIKPAASGAYSPAGVATTEPYTASLSALAIGTYTIYASVTDGSPVPVTSTSAIATFIVAPTVTWTNSAASGNWSNPLSWDASAVPVSGATVIFGAAGSASVLDSSSRTVSSVVFNREAAFTLNNSGGYGLTINNYITSSNKFTNSINAPVTLGGANIWTVNEGSTLQVSGAVGGSAGLTKAGTGTLSLASDNNFTGGMTLKAGTLLLGSGNSLGTGPLTIDGGYINDPTGHLTMPRNNPVVMNGTFTWTGNNGYNWNMGTGAVTLNSPISIYVGNNLTIGGVVSGPGGLNALDIAFKNMVGAGYGVELLAPITLRANQTIPGSGSVISGVIGDAGHGYGVTVAVSDVWGGWGGKATFNAANTYSGDTTVSSGLLIIGHNLALQYSALSTATGIARLSVASPTIGGLRGSTDLASVFTEGYNSVSGLTLNPQSGTCTYSGAIANGTGNMTLTKNGNGMQVLGGTNSYLGATNVNAGTLVLDGSNTGGGAVTVKSGARLGGKGSTPSAVTVQSGAGLLANISDWDAGTCSNLTVATLSLSATWSIDVSAASFTETDRTFAFLTATGSISGFTAQPVNGPGAGTWLVRQSPSDVRILELVYSAVHGTPTTLELASSPNPSDIGDSVTFTATVKAGGVTATGATGTCAFKVDGTLVATVPMVGGAADYSHSFTFGPHAIVATYSGAAAYATSSANFTQICGNLIVPTYTTRADGKIVATFSSGSGLWVVPPGVTSVEVLVLGGGGGAWNASYSTGSGAGGMCYSTSYAVTPGPIGITVGAGATHGTGSSSFFGTQLIAYGGAPGNNTYYDAGDQGAYSLNGGTTVVPGNVGGDYPAPMDGNWTSGGGAGHIGYKGDAQLGGAGAACPITGSVVYYAGGGGAPSSYASSGGKGYNVGGGGTGPAVWNVGHGFSGLSNTGGGGGGGWGGGGGAGGSGVVIVAYQVSPYDNWMNRYPGFNLTDQAADPDKDGLTNYQEFAFGLNPSKGTSANPITAPLDKGRHTFSYTRYVYSHLGYTVWTSTDLKDWAGPAAATQTVVSTRDGVETVEVGLLSPPSGDRLFVRVQAQ